jgi:type IV pilus assembly protein PilY1
MLGVSTSTERDNLINYIRGIDTIDEDGDLNVTEERQWKLGDIFHSSPVLVTPPISPSTDAGYLAFRDAQKNRTTIVLAGANDGMLHAFQESTGTELWGFIPPDQLGQLDLLARLSGGHQFFADSSPVVADVKIGGTWKTVAVFGERRGGRNYHALDITDTTNPQYLWSFTDGNLGETWSEPAIGKVKMADGTTKYVAFVGGGYDYDDNNVTGKAVQAIDLATGTKLWEYYNSSSSDDRQYMNYSIPANPTIADLDRDGFIDRLYVGDVGGQLWKFDLSAAATLSSGLVNNWTGKRVFDAPPAAPPAGASPPAGEFYPEQAIYAAPVPAFDEQKNLWIYFGTGDRNHPNNTTAPNRFYGIKDNVGMTNGSVLTEANLVNVTSANANATQGWYFLLGADEKVLASADVFNKVVFFSTFLPTSASACASGGGAAKLYAVQIDTGYAAVDFSTGVALASTDASKTRSMTIGSGIPSKPVIVLTESGATISTSVIAATTSQQLPSNPAPPPSAMRKVLYWRDVF